VSAPCLPGLFDQGVSPPREEKRGHVRETSVLAKQALVASGALDRRAAWVRDWLVLVRQGGGVAPTSGELARAMPYPSGQWYRHLANVRRGCSDAADVGAIETVPNGKRKCAVSGKACETWRVRTR
jgi:hypothetical protein